MKRVFSVILAVAVLLLAAPSLCFSEISSMLDFAFLSIKASAEDEGLYDDFTCTFDEQTGTYTVDGTSAIPDYDEYIAAPWFDYADKIKSLIITDGITGIGDSAFGGLPAVETVTIGKNVAFIENAAFGLCTSLVSFTVDADNTEFSSVDGVLFNKEQSVLIAYPCGKNGNYAIPDTVSVIGEYAFYGCCNIESMVIGSNVTEIGDAAFALCSNIAVAVNFGYDIPDVEKGLKSLTINGNGTVIGTEAFAMCTFLETVELNSVAFIGDYAFNGCSSSYISLMMEMDISENASGINSLTVTGENVKIGGFAFAYCIELSDIVFDGVTYIDDGAFMLCLGIENLDLSEVEYIGSSAFSGCSGKYFAFEIGDESFNELGLKTVKFGAEGTVIADMAFSMCMDLTTVDFTGVVEVNESAFSYCTELSSVVLENVEIIGDKAFYCCDSDSAGITVSSVKTGLVSVSISGTDVTVGDRAFSDCSLLSEVVLDGVTEIYSNAFYNTAYYSETIREDGCSIYNGKILLTVDETSETEEYTIKEGTEYIAMGAFNYCDNIAAVIVPLSLKYFGYSSFAAKIKVSCKSEIYEQLNSMFGKNVVKTHDSTGVIVTSPVCTEPGVIKYTCKLCGESYYEEAPALGHDYAETVYDATCFERGYTVYSCERCGHLYIGGYTDSEKEHTFVGGVCENCGACEADCVESLHEYANAPAGETASQKWEISKPNADALIIKFSALTSVEDYGDYITISDKAGTFSQTYTGKELASKDITVPGDTAEIVLEVNDSVSDYGFSVIKVTPCYFGLNLKNSSAGTSVSYEVIESDHNYENNEDKIWIITRTGAQSILLKFSHDTRTESNYDFIYIYDKFGTLIGKYSGTSLADETIEVNGDCVQLRLTSDYSSTYYGFAITSVTAKYANNVIDHIKKLIITDTQGCININDMLICSEGVVAVATANSSGFLGTGSAVSITINEISLGDYTVVINGDIDGDSICDVLDAVLVERAANGHCEFDELQIRASGTVEDTVCATDYQRIINRVLT